MTFYAEPESRAKQFDRAHGEDAIEIDEWLVYSDGARREFDPRGALIDPSNDPIERIKWVIAYRETVLQRVMTQFDDLKRHLQSLAQSTLRDGYGAPNPTELEKLKEIKAVAEQKQKELDEAREQLKALKPEHQQKAERCTASNREASEKFLSELKDLRI